MKATGKRVFVRRSIEEKWIDDGSEESQLGGLDESEVDDDEEEDDEDEVEGDDEDDDE